MRKHRLLSSGSFIAAAALMGATGASLAMLAAASTSPLPVPAPAPIVASVPAPAPVQPAAAPAPAPAPAAPVAPKAATAAAPAPAPAPPRPRPAVNPFRGMVIFNPAHNPAAAQAAEWRASRPADAAQMDKIAASGKAVWLGGWSGDIRAATGGIVSAAAARRQLPVLVAYNIPQRDCGSYSAGGAGSAEAYKAWIDGMAAGIGGRRAVVVLEPDATAHTTCLDAAGLERRYALLRYAVTTLSARGASVYIDAGHPHWIKPDDMAARLKRAGIAGATGFSLNVSNFIDTPANVRYGNLLSSKVGGKHYVVDTSRNGRGSSGEWCNPSGRALGQRPGPGTGLMDAALWIKYPGESDGTCAGGPGAGTWWPEYALGLAQRAGF